ncbi:MAG: hypothetical protein ACTSU5_01105 [Promethearchaeota archaeon]
MVLSMNFQEVEAVLNESSPDLWLYDDQFGTYTYKKDVRLNLEIWNYNTAKKEIEFTEPWATEFSDPKAVKCTIKVLYCGAFVKSYSFVYVDGYRCILPIPKDPNKLRITPFQYNLGKILNKLDFMSRNYDDKYDKKYEAYKRNSPRGERLSHEDFFLKIFSSKGCAIITNDEPAERALRREKIEVYDSKGALEKFDC